MLTAFAHAHPWLLATIAWLAGTVGGVMAMALAAIAGESRPRPR